MRKIFARIVTGVVFVCSTQSVQAVPINGQIFEYSGHFYSWIADQTTWPNANAAAQAFVVVHNANTLQDWYLATITSQAENDFLAQTVLGLPTSFVGSIGAQRAWIGLFNENGAINFQWVTGESTSYTNWFPGEPNNSTGTVGTLGRFSNGQWNDEFDTATNGGFGLLARLIEHNGPTAAVPEPSSLLLLGSGLVGLVGLGRKVRKGAWIPSSQRPWGDCWHKVGGHQPKA